MFRQITICQNIIFTLFLSLPDTLRSAAIQSALSKSFLFVVGHSDKHSRPHCPIHPRVKPLRLDERPTPSKRAPPLNEASGLTRSPPESKLISTRYIVTVRRMQGSNRRRLSDESVRCQPNQVFAKSCRPF